jgi:hypothetical protein
MPRVITLHSNFTASDLRRLARLSRDAPQARHLLAQAEGAIEAFKKTSPPRWRASRRTRAVILAPLRSGSRTKRASGRRMGSPPAGLGAAPGLRRRGTSATLRPISSALSARRRAKARPWCCPSATPQR